MVEPSEMMTIGEAARRAGVRASTLRFYESVGLLPAPRRLSGQRRYEAGVLKQVRTIQAAQHAGFSLDEIKTLQGVSGAETVYSERLRQMARQKLPEVVELIEQAQERKATLEASLACSCQGFDECRLFGLENPVLSHPPGGAGHAGRSRRR